MASTALYDVPKTVGHRETNVAALIVFGFILVVASAVGTQVVAERLRYHSALGKPLFQLALPYLRSVYAPWAWVQWCITFLNPLSHVKYAPVVYAALATLPYTLRIGTFVAIIGLGLTAALTGKKEDVVETIDSGRWATARDVEREGFFRQAGPVIGAFKRKRGQVLPLRFDGQNGVEHVALRWTNSSPGSRSTISFAGTRLSEQPIHRYWGACWATSRRKKSASPAILRAAQRRLLALRSSSMARLKRLASSPTMAQAARQPCDGFGSTTRVRDGGSTLRRGGRGSEADRETVVAIHQGDGHRQACQFLVLEYGDAAR